VRGVMESMNSKPQGEREMQFGRVFVEFCFAIPSSESAIGLTIEAVRKPCSRRLALAMEITT
jgi:hypothetical protein